MANNAYSSFFDRNIFQTLKAVQAFETTSKPMKIQNGIYLGEFAVVKFFGDFEFDLKKRKVSYEVFM